LQQLLQREWHAMQLSDGDVVLRGNCTTNVTLKRRDALTRTRTCNAINDVDISCIETGAAASSF
jgi:hypothetical protein